MYINWRIQTGTYRRKRERQHWCHQQPHSVHSRKPVGSKRVYSGLGQPGVIVSGRVLAGSATTLSNTYHEVVAHRAHIRVGAVLAREVRRRRQGHVLVLQVGLDHSFLPATEQSVVT